MHRLLTAVLLALTVAAPAAGQGAVDAVEQARRALAAAEQNGSGELVAASLQELAASQERAGDLAGALDSYRRYADVHERLISEDSRRRVQVLEDERYRFQRNLLGGSIFLLGLVGLTIYRRRTESARLAEQLSVSDPLTGLKNRRYMRLTIGADIAACERKRRYAPAGVRPSDADLIFLLIDLDAFKAVNDEFGHQAGDQVLAQVADVLRESCRASDTIARWGADEFLVVSRFSDRRTGSVLGERIRAAVEHRAFEIGDGRTIFRSCSLGIAPFPFSVAHPAALTWEQVVAVADQALRRAKEMGVNTWVAVAASDSADEQQFSARPGNTLDQWVSDGTATLESHTHTT